MMAPSTEKGQWPLLSTLSQQVHEGRVKSVDLINRSLQAIRDLDPEYKVVIATCSRRALKRAKQIDSDIRNGRTVGLLAGVPFIAKDNILTLGAETTAASNILKGFNSPYQATVIEKLEAEGAICVAKANLDAFAHGSSTENSDFFTTKNPYDKTRVPGGSSGGSAAAVALKMVPFALGTDTGGSVRLPASFCGVVGYKPTYGLVSRSGIVAMASSTDVVGLLTSTVQDSASILDIISGPDKLDSTTISRDPKAYTDIKMNIKNKKIGVVKEYLGEGLDKQVKKTTKLNIEKLKNAGATIQEVSLPTLPLALAVYYVIVPAELSSNLSRYDGQRYGYSYKEAKSLDESYLESRSRGFGDEAKRRIMIGTHVLSSGYYDAYYKKAQTVRTLLINEFNSAFKKYDFLVGPTAPSVAFKIGQNINNPLAMYLMDIMTVSANLTGIPSISVPGGSVNGLPVGFQIMAPQHKDRDLLAMALSYQELRG